MQYKIPDSYKIYLDMLNQIFEIEKKASKLQEPHTIARNLNNLKGLFQDMWKEPSAGLEYENPMGQAYDYTRTDCEASIIGESDEQLEIIEVLKPIIRLKQGGLNQLVQKAVVIVQSKNANSNNSSTTTK